MLTSKQTGIDDLVGWADPAQSVPLYRRKALVFFIAVIRCSKFYG
ncbi:MAG TPA: hypothetical protein VIE69_10750 [Methylophilaceae bacterium]|jgi:hypothetical protein